jgi:predicted transposase YdaD
MPYISRLERRAMERGAKEGEKKGEEKGEKKGEQKGLRAGLLKAIELGLDLRFGAEGLALLPRVRKVTYVRRLESLLEAVRRAKTARGVAARLRG